MKDSTSPSLVRLRRVDYFLEQNDKFVGTKETEDYVKGNDKIPFKKRTWDVARAICGANQDPCGMNKKQVFAWAEYVLFGGPKPAEAAETTTEEVEPARVTAGPTTTAAETEASEEPVATINVKPRVAIYTLLVSARELVRLDKGAGAEELGKLIDAPAAAYLAALNKMDKPVTAIAPQPTVTTATTSVKTPETAPVPVPA